MNTHPCLIETPSLGMCWLEVSQRILGHGWLARYDGLPIKELANLTLVVASPDPDDDVIARLGDAAWLKWMHENFFVQKEVEELGRAPSYAVRLFNYGQQGRDQIQWVVERLKHHAESRSATITTFMPLTDTSYIPCISLLDFWLPHEKVELIVYAHSLDFGKKAYGNLIELAQLQHSVAHQLGRPIGTLTIHAKSAHIYDTEWEYMEHLLQNAHRHV